MIVASTNLIVGVRVVELEKNDFRLQDDTATDVSPSELITLIGPHKQRIHILGLIIHAHNGEGTYNFECDLSPINIINKVFEEVRETLKSKGSKLQPKLICLTGWEQKIA